MNRRPFLKLGGIACLVSLTGCAEGGSDSDDRSPAAFDVTIESYDHEVEEGGPVTVRFNVENTGDETATRDVRLEVDGAVEDSLEIELAADRSTNDSFSYTTDGEDPPEISVAVATDDDAEQRTVTVSPRPPVEALEHEISDVRNPDLGLTSATIPVIFELRNTDPDRAVPDPTIDYNVLVNGAEVLSSREDVTTLGPGETTTTEFQVVADYGQLGDAIVSAIRDESFTVRIAGTVESEGVSTEFEDEHEY